MDTGSGPIIRADDSPLEQEVRDQLERMLASPRFRNAGNQSDFLKLVVERAMQGKKTPAHVIAGRLFPEKVGTDVRVTADNLRKTVKKYYAGEGQEDLVIIALPDPPKDKTIKLPEGEAYTPRFSYNPNHAVSKAIQLGEYHLIRATLEDLEYASKYFTEALAISPEHLRAKIGMAEALCFSLGWTGESSTVADQNAGTAAPFCVAVTENLRNSLDRVADILDDVGEKVAGYWRAHAAAGMFLVVVGEMGEATERFNAALSLNRSMTEIYPPYLGYLVAAARPTEAVELAKRYLNSNIANVGAYATCAMTMAMAGAIPEAAEVITRALKLDRGHAGIRMLAMVFSITGDPGLASQELDRLSTIMDEGSYERLKHEMVKRGALKDDPTKS